MTVHQAQTGWMCPCCGAGVAPFIAVCPRCPTQPQPIAIPTPLVPYSPNGDPIPPGGQWTWSNSGAAPAAVNPTTTEVKVNFPVGATADEPSSEVEISSAPAPESEPTQEDVNALMDELNDSGERRFPIGST